MQGHEYLPPPSTSTSDDSLANESSESTRVPPPPNPLRTFSICCSLGIIRLSWRLKALTIFEKGGGPYLERSSSVIWEIRLPPLILSGNLMLALRPSASFPPPPSAFSWLPPSFSDWLGLLPRSPPCNQFVPAEKVLVIPQVGGLRVGASLSLHVDCSIL